MKKRIAVLAALAEELLPFRDRLRIQKTLYADSHFRFDLGCGDFFPGEIAIGVTGVGKVLSAMATQRLFGLFEPEHIYLIGSCGGATQGVSPGDVIVASSTAQSDYDLTCSGREIGVIKGPSGDLPSFLPTDEEFVARALAVACSFKSVEGRIPHRQSGLMSTRDSLETDLSVLRRIELSFPYLAWEMEAAAVHLVAWLNGCPFNVIKGVLDQYGVYDREFSRRNEAAINFNAAELLMETLASFAIG